MNVLPAFQPMLAVAGPALVQPAPYWLLTALHWLTFTLHLVAMNLLFGLLLVLLLARRHAAVRLLEETAIKIFPVAMAATITRPIPGHANTVSTKMAPATTRFA